jgi:hypothetical protein
MSVSLHQKLRNFINSIGAILLTSANRWHYRYIAGIVITILGLISPWWCSGHWTLQCVNGIGFIFFDQIHYFPTAGTLLILPIAILTMFEIRKTPDVGKWQIFLILVAVIFCVAAIIGTLQLVRNFNHCEGYHDWSTRFLDALFPSTADCEFPRFQRTETARGIWMTLLGLLLMLYTKSFLVFRGAEVKPNL